MSVRFCPPVSSAVMPAAPATTPAELDEALLAAIAKGNRLAMHTLFMRHRVRVHRFAVRFLRDHEMAEDVVSETFFAAWRDAHRFAGRASVSTWLLSIARHKALTALDQRRHDPLTDEQAGTIVDPSPDPEAAIATLDRGKTFRRCLDALTRDHREIIDLVYYQEKSVNEIAGILGIPANTVKTRMYYARRKLAELLEAAGIAPT